MRQQRRVDPVTWSHDGRSFRRGVGIDPAYAVASPGLNVYFVDGWACYPHYCPTFAVGLAFYSPFWCYSDVCAPCIYSQFCFVAPPPFVFVDIPIYVGGVCRGWQSESHEYYLAEGYYVERGSAMDSGLRVCVGDIEHAFRVGDIVRLSDHVDPGVKIAVYIRGRYSYSIGCNDYLDMTRDAMRSMDTVRFGLTSIRRRGHGVYVCSGKHIYRNRAGQIRTVYISFAVKSYAGRWVITQVCTAPDRL